MRPVRDKGMRACARCFLTKVVILAVVLLLGWGEEACALVGVLDLFMLVPLLVLLKL